MVTVEWPDRDHPAAVPFLVRQVDLLRRKGMDVEVFHFRGARNPINYLRAALAIRRKLRSTYYDIIHAQWGQSGLPVMFTSKPLITTFRGSDLFGITRARGGYTVSGRILVTASKFVAMRSKYVVFVSSRLAGRIAAKRNQAVIPSGINFSLFKPGSMDEARKKLGIFNKDKIVLFGGDPDRTDKRFALAQKVIEMLDRPDVYLLTVKNAKHSDMPLYYQSANVLLLTSRHEGSPNVVKEALACNTQVVSVNVGDVSERIENIAGCFLCPSDDPAMIAKSLEQALDFSGPRDYRNAVNDLDEDALADKQIEIYRKIVNGL